MPTTRKRETVVMNQSYYEVILHYLYSLTLLTTVRSHYRMSTTICERVTTGYLHVATLEYVQRFFL